MEANENAEHAQQHLPGLFPLKMNCLPFFWKFLKPLTGLKVNFSLGTCQAASLQYKYSYLHDCPHKN